MTNPKWKPPNRLYLDDIELAIQVSHRRDRAQPDTTEYLHAELANAVAASCRELLDWMRQQSIDPEHTIDYKQRAMMMRARAALAKSDAKSVCAKREGGPR